MAAPHQKHGRLTRLERIVILPVSSPHRLALSSAGRASAVRPAPEPAHSFSSSINKNRHPKGCLFLFGGEGETRTLAPVTRPTPLAGAPRHQLEYFSIGNNSRCYLILWRLCLRQSLWRREWDSNPRYVAVRRFSRPFRYNHFGISPSAQLVYHSIFKMSTLFYYFYNFAGN